MPLVAVVGRQRDVSLATRQLVIDECRDQREGV